MTTRQQQLLSAILRAYVSSAEPVSSGLLAKETKLDISPATIRNDLAVLDDEGFLIQPHTSAGRVPTEKAWRWYVAHLLKQKNIAPDEREQLLEVVRAYRNHQTELLRQLSKTLAQLAQETVVLAAGPHESYYTGLSNLFHQPEFEHVHMVQSMSRVIDRFDEILSRLYDRMEEDIDVLVGKENPFGSETGAVIVRYRLPDRSHGLIGILGPIRQDYDQHVAMLTFTANELKHLRSHSK